MSRKARREITRVVIGNFDYLYSALKKTAFRFDSTNLPLSTVKMAIESIKLPKTIKEMETFREDYKAMLESLIRVCEEYSKNAGTTEIPLLEVKGYIDLLKSDYLKAVRG